MAKSIKRALHAAHLGSAVVVGMAISGMDEAPTKPLLITCAVFTLLTISYVKIYGKDKPTGSDTPIDDAVRRDLGIKD